MTKQNNLQTKNKELLALLKKASQREKELLTQIESEQVRGDMFSGMVDEMKSDHEWLKTQAVPIDEAMERQFPFKGVHEFPADSSKKAQLLSLAVLNPEGNPTTAIQVDQPITSEAWIIVRQPVEKMNVSFMIHDAWKKYVSATHSAMLPELPISWDPGKYRVRMEFPAGIINCGHYGLRAGLGWMDGAVYDYQSQGLRFEITVQREISPHSIYSHGLLAIIPKYYVDQMEGEA